MALIVAVLFLTGLLHRETALAEESRIDRGRQDRTWSELIEQAATLALPTGFLRSIEPGFVTVEFEDLHAFAAEYHPSDHRMVLNRSLSFNAAAGALRPLARLPHRDVGTLYHELFHAYLDFLRSHPQRAGQDPRAAALLTLAERLAACRYQTVRITPIPQRRRQIETRFLNESESWEALNETWAVFVGWVIWSRLELAGDRGFKSIDFQGWVKRLRKADRDGDLIGYYEPQDPAERAITRKRFLAPDLRISDQEVTVLLETILEFPASQAAQAASSMQAKTDRCQAAG